jgi:hypothetical protein
MSTKTFLAAAISVGLAGTAGVACSGAHGAPGSSGTGCAAGADDAIRLALEPTCKACHDVGSNKPIFASLDAFENLLVYDTSLIVPGNPDQSRFVALLEGTAQGTYTQMPLVGVPFATLAAQGSTKIDMQGIKDWISALQPPDPSKIGPSADAPMTRRLQVPELVENLQRTLGFQEVGATDAAQGQPAALWVRDPDAVGAITYSNIGATRTWAALGGGDSLARVKDDLTWSPSALRVVVEMSLEWCTDAVARGDQTIFRDAAPTDTSQAAPDKIRKNIGTLHLRLLGDPAAPADVDAYYQGVFLPAEPRGAAVAWTEVCAALVRDPRYLTF